jgi:hypothetical protein
MVDCNSAAAFVGAVEDSAMKLAVPPLEMWAASALFVAVAVVLVAAVVVAVVMTAVSEPFEDYAD